MKWGVDTYGKKKVVPKVITGSRKINDFMPEHMVELVRDAFNEKGMAVKGRKICILGIAFLENSDDTRNTPALPIYTRLKGLGAEVVMHDVHVKEEEGVMITNDLEEAIQGADAVVLVTAHDEYRELTPEYLKEKMRTPILIDGRNVYDPGAFRDAGFEIRGVGRGN